MGAGDWATWAAAAVAVVSAVAAIWQARKANRYAKLSAEADVRAAAAAERANEIALDLAPKYVPNWELTRRGGHQFALTNRSDEVACVTTIARADGGLIAPTAIQPRDLAPGESLVFMAMGPWDFAGQEWRITWRRPNGEECSTLRPPPSR